MVRRFSVNYAIFSIFVDAIIISVTLWFNQAIRPFLDNYLPAKPIPGAINLPLILYVTFPLIWIFIMASFSVYDGSKKLRVVDEITSLTLSFLLAGVALAGILYFAYRDFSRVMYLIFGLMTYLLLFTWCIIARPIYRQRNRAAERVRHVLIVGAGPVGMEVAKRLSLHKWEEHGLKWVGYLDDDPRKLSSSRDDVLGPVSADRQVVIDQHIDDVVIAIPLRAYARVNELIEAILDLPARLDRVRLFSGCLAPGHHRRFCWCAIA